MTDMDPKLGICQTFVKYRAISWRGQGLRRLGGFGARGSLERPDTCVVVVVALRTQPSNSKPLSIIIVVCMGTPALAAFLA